MYNTVGTIDIATNLSASINYCPSVYYDHTGLKVSPAFEGVSDPLEDQSGTTLTLVLNQAIGARKSSPVS